MRGSWKRGLMLVVAGIMALVIVSDAEGQILRRRRNRVYSGGYTTRYYAPGATTYRSYGTEPGMAAPGGVGVTAPGVDVDVGPGRASVAAPGVGVDAGPVGATIRAPGANADARTSARERNAGRDGIRVRGQTPADDDRGALPRDNDRLPRDNDRDAPPPPPQRDDAPGASPPPPAP